MHRQPLRAEQHFGSAKHKRIVAVIKHVAQNQMNKLVQEERRRFSDAVTDQVKVGRLQCPVPQKPLAERDHQFPILPRIRIAQPVDLFACNGTARVGQQRRGQRPFGGAGVARWNQLWARQVDLQKFVSDKQSTTGIAINEVVTAGQPKIPPPPRPF
ncbi:MAG: hypothetical protein JWP25_902 [Bradyrhizobium sp.]|nr:hypothetical protein [Bradyrhizobium sp.]MEA2865745.1 hypothetical protein [Bradyrhizobium sp.]